MRLISIFVSVLVAFSLYFLIVDRKSLIDFITKIQKGNEISSKLDNDDKSIKDTNIENQLPIVVVKNQKK